MNNNNVSTKVHVEKPVDLSDVHIRLKQAMLEDGSAELTISPKVRNILETYYNFNRCTVIKFNQEAH